MRSLNRPMFRMGGPIKEGVMHGIREPYRGGGVALVGNPVYPKTNGREHHAVIEPTSLETIQAQNRGMIHPAMLRRLIPGKKYFKWLNRIPGFSKTINQAPKKIKGAWGILQPKLPKGGITGSTTGSAWTAGPAKYLSKLKGIGPVAKNLWNQHRYKTLIGGGMGAPYIIEGAKNLPWDKIGGAVTHPIKQWGKVFGIGDDENTDTNKKTDTDTTDKTNLPSVEKVLTDAELKIIEDIKLKNAKAAKDKRVNDLLEIMNYDKSRKNAAYDALIDASEVIRETGFKDESILPIVKATSARFDKPEQIKEAVGLMMAKGEIEKDIAAGKGGTLKQNAKDLYNAGVFKSEKEALEHLSQAKSMREKAVDWAARQKKVIDQTTVIDVMADEYGIRPTVLTSEDEMEKEQKKDTYVDDLTVFKQLKKVQKLDPGYYVIGRAGFIINSDGTIKQVLG